ncbi:MAG: ComEA family DNA-binding protein, partial [Phreatobacter sp.]
AAAPAATAPATTPARPAAAAPAAPAAGTAARPASTSTQAAAPVNLNTATQAELDGLPQIGAARAQAILAERAKGRFLNWEDFERRMAGTSINQTAKDAIRSRIRF